MFFTIFFWTIISIVLLVGVYFAIADREPVCILIGVVIATVFGAFASMCAFVISEDEIVVGKYDLAPVGTDIYLLEQNGQYGTEYLINIDGKYVSVSKDSSLIYEEKGEPYAVCSGETNHLAEPFRTTKEEVEGNVNKISSCTFFISSEDIGSKD